MTYLHCIQLSINTNMMMMMMVALFEFQGLWLPGLFCHLSITKTFFFDVVLSTRWRPRVEDVTQVADAPEAEAQRRSCCQQLTGQSLFPACCWSVFTCWRRCISPSSPPDPGKQDACVQPTPPLKKNNKKPGGPTDWIQSGQQKQVLHKLHFFHPE